jgi:hypothetical protein
LPKVAVVGCVLLEKAVAGGLGCVRIIKQPAWLPTLHSQKNKSEHEVQVSAVGCLPQLS